jgi:hypothetical protein
VKDPTEEDMKKLQRTVKYIRGTVDLGIVLEADKNLSIMAYIDASYGVRKYEVTHRHGDRYRKRPNIRKKYKTKNKYEIKL